MPRAISEKVKSLNASNAPTQKARLSHDDVMNSRDDEQKVTRREENLRLRGKVITDLTRANTVLNFAKTRFSGLKTI